MTVPQSAGALYVSRKGLMFSPNEPSAGGTVTPALPTPPVVPPSPSPTPPVPDRVAQLEKELEAHRADAAKWKEAQLVFARPGTVDAGAQREAMAKSLRAAGWQETEVQQYLEQISGNDPAPEPEPRQQPPAKPRRGTETPDDNSQMQAELDKLRARVDDSTVRMAAYVRDGAIADLPTRVPEFSKAISAIKSIHGEEAANNATLVFRDEIKSLAAQAFMKKAKDQDRMDPNWMLDAVNEAAKVVVRKHQWGIGDPNKIGRTPETGTGDPFAGKPPVPAPVFDPKKADLTDKAVEDFLADALPRLGQLAGGVPSGPSKA